MSDLEEVLFKWSNLKKIGFRFVFIYISLFVVFVNNGAYPFWYVLMKKPTEWLQSAIPWVGKNILNLPYDISVFTNGSGDTTYDYVILVCIVIITLFVTAVWSLLDKKRDHYKTLYYWLTTAVRFYVALMLVSYGMVKVIQLQFSSPGFYRLIESYGDSSPMGLAWTFLGFSKGYNLFMGIAEVSAVLLLFRRTVTVGAIITLMTTANVMAVNYFYDIPVKIVSTHLVLLTLFLLSRDIKKLYKLFFKGESVSLTKIQRPNFNNPWISKVILVFKILIFIHIFYSIYGTLGAQKAYGSKAPKPALYGLYEVATFTLNNDTIPAIKNHTERWEYIQIEREGLLQIKKMDKSGVYYKPKYDSINKNIDLYAYRDSTKISKMTYKKIDSTAFEFNTIIEKDTIYCKAFRKTTKDFLLTNRGFHWISEYPYNR